MFCYSDNVSELTPHSQEYPIVQDVGAVQDSVDLGQLAEVADPREAARLEHVTPRAHELVLGFANVFSVTKCLSNY